MISLDGRRTRPARFVHVTNERGVVVDDERRYAEGLVAIELPVKLAAITLWGRREATSAATTMSTSRSVPCQRR